MSTLTTPTEARELDHRTADGIEVALLWYPTGNYVSVVISDTKSGRALELVLEDRDNALDAFHHPYAYAARRGVELPAVSREADLVATA
jgi:hypothetical protein